MEITLLTIVLASIGWTLLLTASVIGAIFAVNSRFASIDKRFASIDRRFASIDKRLAAIESQIKQVVQHLSLSSEDKGG